MRPRSIVWFEWLYVATLVVGGIQSAVGWPRLRMLANMSFILTVQVITFAVILLLVLLVSRARSNVAKWLLVFGVALGLPVLYQAVRSGHFSGILILTAVQTLAQIVAMLLLFTPEAQDWMHNRTRVATLERYD